MHVHLTQTSFRRLSVITALWGIVFAGVHFYWAAGGTLANDPDTQNIAESFYIAFIAVLGLTGAAVARGLYEPWGARIGRRRLLLLARLGGILLFLGVLAGVSRWLADGSIGDDGAAGLVITTYFLLGALLFSAIAWLRFRDAP
jgi:hypothetical protein